MSKIYHPPFTITPTIIRLISDISEQLGRLSVLNDEKNLRLRRINRIRTIQGSLAIEGSTLSEEQITAILEGKRIIAPPANRVKQLMSDLLGWLNATDQHPLITSSVFHYEFEFIHPFADGNGRMGRLWQTLILGQWNPLLAQLPVESMVHAYQDEYYQALNLSTKKTDSAFFIEFMLGVILKTVTSSGTPQVTLQVTPQVKRLLGVLKKQPKALNREELQSSLALNDRKSFRERYLKPALTLGLIEMTLPDKPNSRLQQYRLTALGQQLANGSRL